VEPTELPNLSLYAVWGPLGILFGLFVYFVVRYGDKLVSSHISFMKTAELTQMELSTSFRTLAEMDGCLKTNRVLDHFANAGKEAAKAHPEVQRQLDRAIDELSR